MASINFYLDKVGKNGFAPIHMRINCEGVQIKLSTKKRVKPEDFDRSTMQVKPSDSRHKELNHYLKYISERAHEFMHGRTKRMTKEQVKKEISSYMTGYSSESGVRLVEEPRSPKFNSPVTFIDLFSGAGGFSEGFLQAEHKGKYFDFLLANDINENCELTHIARYNHQLGLDMEFLCQDVTEPDFLDNLKGMLKGKSVDVVCGGPPCQSFSLAGKRKKFDKKDDLFAHYLEVIKVLRPKYFIMENVKGILTKDNGKIKDRILSEIKSLVDVQQLPKLERQIRKFKVSNPMNLERLKYLVERISFERLTEAGLEEARESYIQKVEAKFRKLTPRIVDYKTSKTDVNVLSIRHGLNMLSRGGHLKNLQKVIMKERDQNNIDNDRFVSSFNQLIESIEPEGIILTIKKSFDELAVSSSYDEQVQLILDSLSYFVLSFEECIVSLKKMISNEDCELLETQLKNIRLYQIDAPFVANASDYGVPQNRERVLFIGCRKDQRFIKSIPPTVSPEEKVSVIEALHDLDMIGNNQTVRNYREVKIDSVFNGAAKKMKGLIRKRSLDGKQNARGKTYSEWSRKGRLIEMYKQVEQPFYVRNFEALESNQKYFDLLHNHQSSNQNEQVVKRLEIIRKSGDYKAAQEELNACGLSSKKRNYNVLDPERQSPTVMTIPDDYIHYRVPRALTVREMARLQSFDDSFVFQGKRSTGGNNRKSDVPQFTLVGNAVPPLMARAVASEILEKIR